MEKVHYEIRDVSRKDWDMAVQLAWDTFLVYEAPEYSLEGIRNFHDFVKGKELKRLHELGEYEMYGAYCDGVIIGVISVRKNSHVSLLFVEPQYHHQGIASTLLKYCFELSRMHGGNAMTVNSSPYAVQFYHKIGFRPLSPEVTKDGIKYTPMKITI